jgi:hypothetical protein
MSVGPSRYDPQSIVVIQATGARAVVVIVIGGVHGDGMSVALQESEVHLLAHFPALLRKLADDIEGDARRLGPPVEVELGRDARPRPPAKKSPLS